MGLFINSNGHPDVFKSNTTILERNQGHSKIDSLSEWMMEQKKVSDSVNDQFNVLETLIKQQKHIQSNQLKSIRNRLNELQDNDFRHEKFENDVLESLNSLDDKNSVLHRMLENEHELSREFIMQVNNVSESNKEIANYIEVFNSANEEIAVKMNEQLDHQKQLSEQIAQQEDVQKIVMSRLDNQEGVTEKMVRQLDHLRAVLYERTSFLTEKIEHSYSTTAAYIAKLMTGSEQPTARFLMNQKQEEKQKSPD